MVNIPEEEDENIIQNNSSTMGYFASTCIMSMSAMLVFCLYSADTQGRLWFIQAMAFGQSWWFYWFPLKQFPHMMKSQSEVPLTHII